MYVEPSAATTFFENDLYLSDRNVTAKKKLLMQVSLNSPLILMDSNQHLVGHTYGRKSANAGLSY